MTDQILAVLDHYERGQFVVSGYSAGGAMAAAVACSTDRAIGMVCGGFALAPARPSVARRLDRRLAPKHPSRELWAWMAQFKWPDALAERSIPRLLYWGSEDRQMARTLRKLREELALRDVDFVEFAGYSHAGCNTEPALTQGVVPTLRRWAVNHGLIPA
jgi:pimeloyl-ACP methyl ester carboxylesterase